MTEIHRAPGYENQSDDSTDETEEDVNQQKVEVGLAPMGGIGINVTERDGTQAGATLTIEQAEQLGARLIGLAGMMVHVGYMEMARQQIETQKVLQNLNIPGK